MPGRRGIGSGSIYPSSRDTGAVEGPDERSDRPTSRSRSPTISAARRPGAPPRRHCARPSRRPARRLGAAEAPRTPPAPPAERARAPSRRRRRPRPRRGPLLGSQRRATRALSTPAAAARRSMTAHLRARRLDQVDPGSGSATASGSRESRRRAEVGDRVGAPRTRGEREAAEAVRDVAVHRLGRIARPSWAGRAPPRERVAARRGLDGGPSGRS